MNISSKKIRPSYGCELEWSDVDRKVDIPVNLGEWEGPKIAGYYMGSEIDIVNTKGKYKGVGTDPLCVTCKVGGEIHTQPSYEIDSQVLRMMRILDLFPTVNVACPNHGHIHVGLAGILNEDNIGILKNIFRYTEVNQDDLIQYCCGYDVEEATRVSNSELQTWVKQYLLVGDGKHIRKELFDAVERATSVQEILEAVRNISCEDWEWVGNRVVATPESRRTAVNLYNLSKGETIEFRIFRATINPVELYSCLYFVKRYIEEAFLGTEGKPVSEILKEGNFKFPKLNFNYDLAKGWQDTRQTKGRCGPFKKYTGVMNISEDSLVETSSENVFEKGLTDILALCKLDFQGKTIDSL